MQNKKKEMAKRIAVLIDVWFPFYGGGQVHVRELSKVLKKDYKYKIELFYSPRSSPVSRFFWSLYVIPKVLRYTRQHPINLIHSHGFIAGLPAKILSLFLKIPVVHTIHGSHLLDQKTNGPKAWLEKILLTKISYSTEISVAGSFLKYENRNKNIVVIPNGVNVKAFDSVKVQKNKSPSLIWVGRNHPDKGITYLREAIQRVRRVIPNLKTELVTNGKLTGQTLIKAYKRAHLFVLPSLAEGQPITLLEAWAAKLPIVVTSVGDNPSMVKDGVNGILIEPGNVSQLSKAIVKLLKNKDKARQMGLSGYRLVTRHYTWYKIAAATHHVYQSLLK